MTGIHVKKEYKKWMFLFAYGIYLVSVVLFDSKYRYMESLRLFFPIVRFLAYGLVCTKIVLDFFEKEYSLKELGLIAGIGILFLISAAVSKNKNLLIFWVFIVSAHDVDFREIIKWSLWVHIAALLFVIGSCYAGIVENQIYIQDNGNRIRESLGFDYTTQSAHYYFYMILFWVYWRKEKITWKELAVITAANIYFFIKTDTKNAFALGTLAIVGTIILKYVPYLRNYNKIYSLIAAGIAPLMSIGIILFSIRYDGGVEWMQKCNKFITGRLGLGHQGYLDYGIRLFGQPVSWEEGGYHYVDSSYMQTILCLGIVIFLLILIGLVTMGIFIAIRKDTYFLLVYALFVVHSTFDSQLIWIGYNSFLMFYSYIKNGERKTFHENPTSEYITSQS